MRQTHTCGVWCAFSRYLLHKKSLGGFLYLFRHPAFPALMWRARLGYHGGSSKNQLQMPLLESVSPPGWTLTPLFREVARVKEECARVATTNGAVAAWVQDALQAHAADVAEVTTYGARLADVEARQKSDAGELRAAHADLDALVGAHRLEWRGALEAARAQWNEQAAAWRRDHLASDRAEWREMLEAARREALATDRSEWREGLKAARRRSQEVDRAEWRQLLETTRREVAEAGRAEMREILHSSRREALVADRAEWREAIDTSVRAAISEAMEAARAEWTELVATAQREHALAIAALTARTEARLHTLTSETTAETTALSARVDGLRDELAAQLAGLREHVERAVRDADEAVRGEMRNLSARMHERLNESARASAVAVKEGCDAVLRTTETRLGKVNSTLLRLDRTVREQAAAIEDGQADASGRAQESRDALLEMESRMLQLEDRLRLLERRSASSAVEGDTAEAL